MSAQINPLASPDPATTAWVPIWNVGGSSGAGFEIGYDQITSNVTVSSSTESAGTTVIACQPHTFDGNPVEVEFFCPDVIFPGTVNANVTISLFEGSTQIGRLAVMLNPSNVGYQFPCNGRLRFSPSAGPHTYTVTAFYGVATGPVIAAGLGGTAYVPTFIRFKSVQAYTGPQAGMPTPVVNGQWLKGVGGAVTWQPLTVTDVTTQIPSATIYGSPAQAISTGGLTSLVGSTVAYNNSCIGVMSGQTNPAVMTLTRAGWYSFCLTTMWNSGSVDANFMHYIQGAFFPGGAVARGAYSTNYGRDGWTVTAYNSTSASTAVTHMVQMMANATLSAFQWTVTYLGGPP